ncbi:MAG TPA: multicopper oxidase domain-containing protein, partial [Steroidobacteraceae bacterium]
MQRLAGATLIASAAGRACLAGAASGAVVSQGLRGGRGAPGDTARGAILSGVDFDLQVDSRVLAVTGVSRGATLVNGRLPAPLLYWRQGDTVRVRVANRLRSPTSLHWHGILVPAAMDGVPGLSFEGIAPGSTFDYRFRLEQAGTYWYHSHSRFQEQLGLYGPIVIAPADGDRHASDREHVLLLSDWTDRDPEQIYRTLKRDSEYFNYSRRTAADFLADGRRMSWSAAMAERRMWGSMRMSPTDILDVAGHAYTYLLNGITPAGNWTGLFAPGETLRLRILNGSSMSFFDLRIPGLTL